MVRIFYSSYVYVACNKSLGNCDINTKHIKWILEGSLINTMQSQVYYLILTCKKRVTNVTNGSSRKYNGFVTKVSISCF